MKKRSRTKQRDKALRWAIDTIIWMSGASDFGPEGRAQKGWFKVRRRLSRFMKLVPGPIGAREKKVRRT